MRVSILFLLFVVSFYVNSKSQFIDSIIKKQQSKQSTRWTLSDWMAQKKSFSMMDMWLASNRSKDLFEFSVTSTQSKYDLGGASAQSNLSATSYKVHGSIGFLGLVGEHRELADQKKEINYQLDLRLLGGSAQGTNLTVSYGQRQFYEQDSLSYKNNFYGADLTLYIFSGFGLNGSYKKHDNATMSSGTKVEQVDSSYGAFVEFSLVRFYYKQYTNSQTQIDSSANRTNHDRTGSESGVQVFF